MQISQIHSHENTSHIILSIDEMSCFKYKQPGHIASQCTIISTTSIESHAPTTDTHNTISSTWNLKHYQILRKIVLYHIQYPSLIQFNIYLYHSLQLKLKENSQIDTPHKLTKHRTSICKTRYPAPQKKTTQDLLKPTKDRFNNSGINVE